MPPKIVFIGAGSTVFAKNLMGDILSFPELADATLTLFDIDPERLRTSEVVAHKVATALDARPTIEATTDRRRALDGADYAICMIQVGGYKPATVIDFEIPNASSRDIFGCSKNRQNRIVENSTYPLDDFGFR